MPYKLEFINNPEALELTHFPKTVKKLDLFKRYLLSAYYTPGTVLGTWDTLVNKIDKNLP